MGLIKDILHRPTKDVQGTAYSTFTQYQPVFTSFSGSIHEQELVRSAVERFATAASKLEPSIHGNAKPRIVRAVESYPNEFMTWSAFISRLAAIYDIAGTAFVIPQYAWDHETITGLFPLNPAMAEVVESSGEPWIRFTYATGEVDSFPFKDVCIISKFQYSSDFFGEDNCLDSTIQLLHAQEQAQDAALKNGSNIRFIGKLLGQVREDDITKKRQRFVKDNFGVENTAGIMVYDQTWEDIKQIQNNSYTMSEKEMERIERNVFNYFGINEDILQNKYEEDVYDAWYEGKVEPFALKLSEGLSKMLFTQRELRNNGITFSSSRLAFASNASKRDMIRDMVDRGVFTLNQALEILQMPTLGEDGDVRIIRGEYLNAKQVSVPMNLTDDEKKDYDGDDTRNPWEPESLDSENG